MSELLGGTTSIDGMIDNSPQFTSDWFSREISTWNSYKPLFCNKEDMHCLEIGSYEGRSSIYMLNNFCNGDRSYLDALDTWEGSIEHSDTERSDLYNRFINNVKPYIDAQKLFIYKGLSVNTLNRFVQETNNGIREKYDVIYVDGSHIAKDVLSDARLAWGLLKKDGIMMFDDYLWRFYKDPNNLEMAPKLGIDMFLKEKESMYELIHKNYQIHIKKIID